MNTKTNKQKAVTPKFITLANLMEYCGLKSRSTIYNHVKEGRLNQYKFGNKNMYSMEEVENLISSSK